jgi:hypothetical protein
VAWICDMEVAFPAGAKGRPRRRRSIRGDELGGEENSHSWGGTAQRRKKTIRYWANGI